MRDLLKAFVERYQPTDELECARFRRDLDEVIKAAIEETTDGAEWEPIVEEHNQTIESIREVFGAPETGTWRSQTRGLVPVEKMADGHILNVARRLLFGPIDKRRLGQAIRHEDAIRRAASFPWLFEEVLHRGLQREVRKVLETYAEEEPAVDSSEEVTEVDFEQPSRAINSEVTPSSSTAPARVAECTCGSTLEVTGLHAAGCPLFLVRPDEPLPTFD